MSTIIMAPRDGILGADWIFLRHILLWAKGWYPELGNHQIAAVRRIMSEVFWTEIRFVSDGDAAGFIVDTYYTFVSARRAAMDMQDLFIRGYMEGDRSTLPMDKILRRMSNSIRHTHADTIPPMGKPDLPWVVRIRESEEDRDEDLEDFRLDFGPKTGAAA